MRAVQIRSYGGPEVLSVNDVDFAATPGPGQVLVDVAAAGVNPVDWKIREGYMKDLMPLEFPVTLGNEIAGTVAALGEGVTEFAVGDEVFGNTGPVGAFTDKVIVPAAQLAAKPAALSPAQAAALPVAIVTTQAAFDLGEVGPGTRISIHAAAGGVGTVAIQMARALGAHVTALTSPSSMDFVRALGADEVVDRTTAYDNSIGGFDFVFDGFGPEAQERSWPLLKEGGILVTLVAPPDEEKAKAHKVRAAMAFGAPNGAVLQAACALVEQGKLKPHVQSTYRVEKAGDAMAEVQAGKVRGKVVLTF